MRNTFEKMKSVLLYTLFCTPVIFSSCERDVTINDNNGTSTYPPAPLARVEQAFPDHEKEIVILPNGVIVEKVLGLEKDLYIFQGDIVLEEKDLARFGGMITRGSIRDESEYIWSDNEVYYYVDTDFRFVNELNDAIAHWKEKTNLRFILTIDSDNPLFPPIGPPNPFDKSLNYIKFRNSNGQGTYSSYIGRKTGVQYIAVDDWAGRGEIIHEIGHAIGLFHEQSRLDRDEYVTIHWDNLENSANARFQYMKWNDEGYQGADVGVFDFGSIMLYHSWAFSKYEADMSNNPSLYWNNPVMTKKNGETFIPQRDSLSTYDILAVNYLYPNPEEPKGIESTTLTFKFEDYDTWTTLKFREMLETNDTVYIDFGNGNNYKGLVASIPDMNYSVGTHQVKIWSNSLHLKANGKFSNGSSGAHIYLPLVKAHLSQDTKYTGIDFSLSRLKELTYNEAPDFSSIVSFYGTFKFTDIEKIERDLFSRATNAIAFQQTFFSAKLKEIPRGLFDDNPNVLSFKETFYHNPITSIPEGLFDVHSDVSDFFNTFAESNIGEIPQGLFDHNPLVQSFNGVFRLCPIISIPEGLFNHNLKAIDFTIAFGGCDISTMPSNLFSKNVNATKFLHTFSNCKNLMSIPEGLFSGVGPNATFNNTFQNCINLNYAIPLWESYSTGYNNGCYIGCINVNNWSDIPANWKQ